MEQSAFCEKQDFEKSGDRGYWVFRIPGLITTKKGTVIAWYDARMGKGSDWDPIDIVIKRSFDNGVTWEEPRVLVGYEQYSAAEPVNNLVLFADLVTGDVHCLYCTNYERLYYMKSDDEGASFSEPTDITSVMETYRDRYAWQVIAPGPGHGIQLTGGRLVIPVWMSEGTGEEFGNGKKGHRPSDVVSIYSDDHGQTWRPGEFVVRTSDAILHPNETVPVELSDGTVLFNVRTESDTYRRLIVTSPDGAGTWSQPYFDEALPDPICFGSIIKLPEQQGYPVAPILFANLSDLTGPQRTTKVSDTLIVRPYARQGLTIKASVDDCRTWMACKSLESGPAQYSDLAVAADGTILCLYERGAKTEQADERYLTLARFNWAWVVED
ncbi:sialidase family protein [Paenibacillus thalictri]|nr:sialidase family protein [Paenibacillus thalictri]